MVQRNREMLIKRYYIKEERGRERENPELAEKPFKKEKPNQGLVRPSSYSFPFFLAAGSFVQCVENRVLDVGF